MERKSSSILFLTFLVVVLMFGFVSISTDAVQNNKEIIEAWWEAYDGDKKPEQVYECLEKVLRLYATHNISELSWEDQKRKRLFDTLFDGWNPTPDQCNEDDFTKRDSFPQYFLVDYPISQYWLHCERKRVQVCEPVIEAQLKAEFDQIREVTTGHRVKLLVDSVMSEPKFPNSFDDFKSIEKLSEVLTAGTLKYLETLEGPLSKSVLKLWGDAEDRFIGVYKRLVIDLCATVFDTGRKQLEVSKVIKKYNQSWQPFGLVKQWMQADRICEHLVLPVYKRLTFKLLCETNRGKGLLGLGREI